jgi:hypothetical protein
MAKNLRNTQDETLQDENLGAGIDPIFVVDPVGQQNAYVYPSEGLSGTVINALDVVSEYDS